MTKLWPVFVSPHAPIAPNIFVFAIYHTTRSSKYIDPKYSGNGYDEYVGDESPGVLDCQEFYQYIKQISKHLWAIDVRWQAWPT